MEHVLALVDAILIVAVSLVFGYLGNDRFKTLERRFDRLEDRMDRRFEQFLGNMDGRFAQVDARFAQVDARFAQVDARFERLEQRLDSGLDAVRADITHLALTLVPPREAEQT